MFGKLLHIWDGKFGERKIMQTFQVLGLLSQIVYTFSHTLLLFTVRDKSMSDEILTIQELAVYLKLNEKKSCTCQYMLLNQWKSAHKNHSITSVPLFVKSHSL